MNHNQLIPLATASLLFAIARPAMAATSGATLVQSIGYVGPALMIFGVGIIAAESLSLARGIDPTKGEAQKIFFDFLLKSSKGAQAGKLLFGAGLVACCLNLIF
jgi:hypothetical protein